LNAPSALKDTQPLPIWNGRRIIPPSLVFPIRLLPPKLRAGISSAATNQPVCRDGYLCYQPFEKDKTMKLESLREIKSHFLGNPAATFAVGIARPEQKMRRSIALGIGAGGKLAVRCYGGRNQSRLQNAFVEAIMKQCRGEADVVRGLEMPMAFGWMDELRRQLGIKNDLPQHGKARPALIGWSVGHGNVTCGSIGAFAKVKGEKRVGIVSNNHVLSCSNDAKPGDLTYQPGVYDGKGKPDHVVGSLHSFVKLQREHNVVDAAFALLNEDIGYDTSIVGELGAFNGMSNEEPDVGMETRKFGRTSSSTVGKITAIEVDNLLVGYGKPGTLSFDRQIEIMGHAYGSNDEDTGEGYLRPGDSGSMTMDSKNRALALNFAGSSERAYANPMTEVVKALKLTLVK
jgi:hypothetical protein